MSWRQVKLYKPLMLQVRTNYISRKEVTLGHGEILPLVQYIIIP